MTLRPPRIHHAVRALLVLSAVLGPAAPAISQTEEVVRTLAIGPGGSFSLGNLSGDISVTATDDTNVALRATKRLRDAGSAEDAGAAFRGVTVEIRERAGRVDVETDYDDLDRGGPPVAVDYDVAVPRGTHVSIESVSGDVTVEGVEGAVRVEVVSGDVELTALAGGVDVEGISGGVRLTDVRGDAALSVESVSGDVTLDRVAGPRVDVSAVSGDVTLRQVTARRIDAEVVSGSIEFEGTLAADGEYDFESHSGEVRLAVPVGSGFELEVESFSGILSSTLPIVVEDGNSTREITSFENGVRSLDGVVGGGGAEVEVSTFSGTIAIVTR